VIKYIGSKRTLLPGLVQLLRSLPELRSAADLFSGTSRVGHAFKHAGLRVVSNDHNAYAFTLARCYVEADRERVESDTRTLLAELGRCTGRAGYFTETFCVGARFFQPHNGERIDAIREEIERKGLDPILRSVVLTSLMEAADRVDSTCGLQMAYVKKWAPRSYNDLELRMPDVLPAVAAGDCRALQMDANAAARELDVDIAYLDPPYNQHSYLSNYHIWESLVLWDKPPVYGVAHKRIDCRTRKSDYNSKRAHKDAFVDLVESLDVPLIVVSFNNEGYQSRDELETMLASKGEVFVITKDFKRYVGAQIGVYNPSGDKVGQVSHLRNKEHIYLVATPALFDRVPDARRRLRELARSSSDGEIVSGAAMAAPLGS
jgi:adenine-specific DNA-methyltransferase